MGFGSNERRVVGKGTIDADKDAVKNAFRFGRSGGRRFGFTVAADGAGRGIGRSISRGRSRRQRGLGRWLILLLTKLQCLLLEGFEGLLTLFWGVDSEDHP